MNKFDEELFHMAKDVPIEVPPNVSNKIDEVLVTLPDTKIYEPKNSLPTLNPRVVAACIGLVLFLIPNMFPTLAHSMDNIPVLGDIIKIITIRDIDYNDGNHIIDVEVPSVGIEDINGNIVNEEVSSFINADINELVTTLLDEFNSEYIGKEGYGSLNIHYDVVTNSDTWFTLRITVLETSGSSNTFYKFYHIDKFKGDILSLSDLFIEDSGYIEIISDEIYRQMILQMENDDSTSYWIGDAYPEEKIYLIKGNQNFYISERDNIVIVFDKYEVAPGMMGCPEFEISKDLYIDYLK